jgi:hypothetical protein
MTFIDLPITGDKQTGHQGKEQHDRAELTEAFKALFDNPSIHGLRWTQYTPHFNDGDACIFSVNEYGWRIAPTDTPDEYLDGEDDETGRFTDLFGGHKYSRNDGKWIAETIVGSDRAAADVLRLRGLMVGGHHDNSLIDLFGDHAEVGATRDGFVIDYFTHD